MKKNIKAVVKIFGLPHSSSLRDKEIYPAINKVCPPDSVLAVIVSSSVEVCDGKEFHPPGNSPIFFEIFSSNPAMIQAIGNELLACKSAERFTVRAQLCIDIEP